MSTRITDGMTGRLPPLGRAAARRSRLPGWACALAVLGLAGLGLLALILVALPLLVLYPIGARVLLGTLRLLRRFADAQRWMIGSTLHDGRRDGYGSVAFDPDGLRLLLDRDGDAAKHPHGYPPWPSGSRWRQLRLLATEPTTRQDLTWLLVAGPAGLVLALLVALPPAAVLMAGFWTGNGRARSLIGIPVALVGLLLWWWTAPVVMRGYALLGRRMLGSAATTSLTTRIRALLASRSTLARPPAGPTRRARLETLTPREREVLALVAEGRTNAAIAAQLYVTEKAVDKHINSVFRKLDLAMSAEDNRRVLAALAYLRE